MKTYCKYHPLEASRWVCGQCFGHFCRNCVPTADEKKRSGNCPLCHKPLRYLGASNEAKPFWTRIGEFFQYPLAKDPILLILLCTILPLFVQSSLLGLGIVLFLTAIQTKYVYSIIEHTAEGNMKPPELGSAFQGGGLILLLQQFAVLIGMFMATGLSFRLGGVVLGLLMLAFVVLVFPASVIVLAMEKSVTEAINPIKLMAIIGAIGWPYFVLYGYLILVFLSLSAADDFIVAHFDPMIGYPLMGLSSSYFMMVVFHMLGYMLFQYQYQLGFSADLVEDAAVAPVSERQAQQQAQAEVDILLKEGQYEKALEILSSEFRKHSQDLNLLDRLYRLSLAMQAGKKLRDIARPALRMLLTQNRIDEAAALLKQLYTENDFELGEPLLAFHLAQALHNHSEHRLVLRVLKDMHKDYPDFEFLPDAYVLVAKSLANGLHDQAKALSYLKFVKTKFPQHPLQARMEQFMESLQHKGLIV